MMNLYSKHLGFRLGAKPASARSVLEVREDTSGEGNNAENLKVKSIFLFSFVVFVWSTTWIAIKYQLGIIPPAWSLVYRFTFATFILFIYCLLTQKSLRFSAKDHIGMFVQGCFLFSLNYLFYYYGSQYLLSGLVAVIFASMIIFNIFNNYLFFKKRIEKRVFIGAIVGLTGLAIIFSHEFLQVIHSENNLRTFYWGILLCTSGTFIASFGNIAATYNNQKNIPVLQSTTFSMLYGSLILFCFALFTHQPIRIDTSYLYLSSLFYLSFAGTVLGFSAYLQLMKNIGSARAAYAFILLPFIALLISSWVEQFSWTSQIWSGLSLIIMGNVLVLYKPKLPNEKSPILNINETA